MRHRTVRCACHVTKPLDSDRWSFCLLGHRTVRWCTGQALCTVRCALWLCSDSGAHCSAFNAFCRRPLVRSSCCSVGTPDSSVRHRTLSGAPATSPGHWIPNVGASIFWATGQSGGAPDRHCSVSGAPSGSALTLAHTVAHLMPSVDDRWCEVVVAPLAHRTVR